MANDSEIGIKFSADTSGLAQGMKDASQATREGVAQIQEHFNSLNESFGLITKGFGMVMAALAGGAAFKEFVSDAVAVTKESMALGKALGVSATEASIFRSALASAGVSQDAVAIAGKRLSMSMATGGKSIEALGVATKDSNGNFKDSQTIMLEVNEKLKEFKEGTDRNIEGVKVYGRAWSEVAPMIGKIDTSKMKEAEEKARSLNLIVGQESVAAVKAYGQAQRDAHEVMEGVNRTVGDALIPRLTQLGEWFASVGPQAVEATRGVMATYLVIQDSIAQSAKALWDAVVEMGKGVVKAINEVFGLDSKPMEAMEFFRNLLRLVEIAFIGLRVGIQVSAEFIKGTLQGLMSDLRTFADVAVAALHLDFAGVKDAWQEGTARTEKILSDSMDRMVAIARKGGEDIESAALGSPTAASKVTAIKPGKDGKHSAGADAGTKTPSQVGDWERVNKEAKDSYEYTNGLRQRDLTEDVLYWQSKLAIADKDNGDLLKVEEKLAAAKLAVMKKNFGEAKALTEESINASEKAAIDDLALSKSKYDQQLALGKITQAQMIQIELQNEDQKLAIQRAAQLARIQMAADDPSQNDAALQTQKDKLLEIERAYQVARTNLQTKAAVEDAKYGKQFEDGMASGFNGVIKNFAQGTMTIQNLFLNMGRAVLTAFTDIFAQIAAKWLANKVMQEVGAKVSSLAQIAGNAAVAGSAAFASTAAIPITGPALAPEAAAAAYSGAMSFAKMPGFEVGSWNVPGDMFTKVHAGETILNPGDASKFRSAVDGMSGGGGGDTHNWNIHAVDAQGVRRLLLDNPDAFAAAARHAVRNGHKM